MQRIGVIGLGRQACRSVRTSYFRVEGVDYRRHCGNDLVALGGELASSGLR
jgi:hypothetical protein